MHAYAHARIHYTHAQMHSRIHTHIQCTPPHHINTNIYTHLPISCTHASHRAMPAPHPHIHKYAHECTTSNHPCTCTLRHSYIQATCIKAYTHTQIHYIHTCVHTCMHTSIHTLNTHMLTYIACLQTDSTTKGHTSIHQHMHTIQA